MDTQALAIGDMPTLVNCGTFTATNGSLTLVGATSLVKGGDSLLMRGAANYLATASVDSSGGNISLTEPWKAATTTGTLYAAHDGIPEEAGEYISRTDQLGTLAERATLDAQADGYTYLCVDDPPIFYVRRGTATGVWYNAATSAFIWVDPVNGLDTNEASYTAPLQTINAAIILASTADADLTGMTLYIALKAGTYNQQVNLMDVKGAPTACVIIGEVSLGGTTSRTSYVVSSALGDTIRAISIKTIWLLSGFSVGSTKGHAIVAKNARLRFSQLRFNACSGAHVSALGGGTITLAGPDYSIAGSATAHLNANGSGAVIDLQGEAPPGVVTVNIPGSPTPSFTTAYAWARASGQIFTGTGLVFTGIDKKTVGGRRWRAEQNSSIDSGQSGEKYLPGNTAGIAVKSGEYL